MGWPSTVKLGLRKLVAVATALLAPGAEAANASGGNGLRFVETGAAWGVDFRHHHGGRGDYFMIETMGSGAAVLDYDGDGDQDVFLVDSGTPAPYLPAGSGAGGVSRLFRNDGGRFVDVTARAGIVVSGYGMGVTAADVEGDLDLDLYVTAFGANQLFVNQGDGTFADGTARAGIGDPSWSSSAAFGVADRDGDLDLYVTNYLDFAYDRNHLCGRADQGLRSYCHPNVYRGLPDRFFRNRGDGTFEDATAAAGFGEAMGNGLGVLFGHIDDGDAIDLFVANDMTPNFLFAGRGDGTFEDVALLAGAALSHRGEPEAGMGVEAADFDGDGRPDLVVNHIDLLSTVLYANNGAGTFADRRFQSGLAEPSLLKVGFGVGAADFDLDGDLDLIVANGHILHDERLLYRGVTYRQANQVFENRGDGRFALVADAGLGRIASSRGLALGDLDGDLDWDVVINNNDDTCELYENRSAPRGSALSVELLDGRSRNPQALGARLRLVAGAREPTRELRSASSYQSQHETAALFGLGAASTPPLEIRWPDGLRTLVRQLPQNVRVRVVRN